MSNLYRGPSIDASYHVSYHLAKRFQRKSTQLGQIDRNLVGSIYGRSSGNCSFRFDPLTNMAVIGNSYQVSDHLAMRFQRRFLEIDQSETRIACGGHVC
jgi:hypothetical protein